MTYFIGSDHTHIDYHKNNPMTLYSKETLKNFDYELKTLVCELYVVEHVYDTDNNYVGSWFTITDDTKNKLKQSSMGAALSGGNMVGRIHGTTETVESGSGLYSLSTDTLWDRYFDLSNATSEISLALYRNKPLMYRNVASVWNCVDSKAMPSVNPAVTFTYNATHTSTKIIGKASDYPLGMQYCDRMVFELQYYVDEESEV